MLKAKVRVITHQDGKRIEFQPGEEVTGLHPHDKKALLEQGALEDVKDTERQEKKEAAAEKKAAAEFEAARRALLLERDSIKPPEAPVSAPENKKSAGE